MIPQDIAAISKPLPAQRLTRRSRRARGPSAWSGVRRHRGLPERRARSCGALTECQVKEEGCRAEGDEGLHDASVLLSVLGLSAALVIKMAVVWEEGMSQMDAMM